MKIDIKKDTYEFLKNLAKDMKDQDNRITVNPRYYAIQDDEEIYGLDLDYTDDIRWISEDNDIVCTLEEALKHYELNEIFPSIDYFFCYKNSTDYSIPLRSIMFHVLALANAGDKSIPSRVSKVAMSEGGLF
jgi:hypothetical protein